MSSKDFLFLDLFPDFKTQLHNKEMLNNIGRVTIDAIFDALNTSDRRDMINRLDGELSRIHQLNMSTRDIKRYFDALEEGFSFMETDCWRIFSFICEQAISCNFSDNLTESLDKLSLASEIETLSFLSAWLRMNRNELAECIQICLRITHPFSPILGLLGQAYLETKQFTNAVAALEDATEIAPFDVTNWYLLSQAYQKSHLSEQAWGAIQRCIELKPDAIDIPIQMAVIARSAQPENISWKKEALNKHLSMIVESRCAPEHFVSGLQLSLDLDCTEAAWTIIERSDYKTLLDDSLFKKQMGSLLKQLNEKRWAEHSVSLLNKIEQGIHALTVA